MIYPAGWLFLIVIVTEYGLAPKSSVRVRLASWSWKRELARGVLWLIAYFSFSPAPARWQWWASLAASWAVSAAIVAGMRFLAVRKGEILLHLLPALVPAVLTIVGGFFYPGVPPSAVAATTTVLLIAGAAGMLTWGTAITVAVVDLARPQAAAIDTPVDEARHYSPAELIGILERLLIFILVYSSAWTAVGLVIAAKSAARFPEFKQKAFAEYFLIGTLTSVGLAAAAGMIAASVR
jgi:hypothetical protein